MRISNLDFIMLVVFPVLTTINVIAIYFTGLPDIHGILLVFNIVFGFFWFFGVLAKFEKNIDRWFNKEMHINLPTRKSKQQKHLEDVKELLIEATKRGDHDEMTRLKIVYTKIKNDEI